MIRPPAWALVALMLATAPAVTAETPTAEPSDCGGRPCPDEPTYGDCGAEVCAYGNETCIECSGPIESHTNETCADCGSCMDGTAAHCDDGNQYLDGRGPPQCENCRGEDAGPVMAPGNGPAVDAKPAGALGALAVLALALLAFVRRR